MVATIAAAVSAASALGGLAMSASRDPNAASAGQTQLAQQQLDEDKQNRIAQQIVQAMINQRAVSGTQDPYGGGTQYDPTTNTWTTTQGALPAAADRSAMQATVTRNTTDLQQQELANREAMLRAARAQPGADAAQRELSQFRAMPYSQLVGLLSGQATEAARQAYDPLRADVLRSVARTGSAAGPVLSQLGMSEAQNLRNSLRDSLVAGMTGADEINQKRRAGLETAAANAQSLANPALGASGIQGSSQGATMQQLAAQRAAGAASQTAYGMQGANQAGSLTNSAYGALRGAQGNPNASIDAASGSLKSLGSLFDEKGQGTQALSKIASYFGSSGKGGLNADGSVSPDYSNETTLGSDWLTGGGGR